MNKIVEKELSYKLVGIFFEIQKELGRFCRERQYADILEKKLLESKLSFKREFPIEIGERKSNFADFLIENKILIDLKAKPFIEKEDFFQTKRYLKVSGIELGLIVNFQDRYLKPKRVLNPDYKDKNFVDSDKFVVSERSRGFTMVELLVAMSLFIVVISLVSGVFVRALRTQRTIVALIAANGNAALTIEQMMREIRTGKSFSVTGNELSFVNAKDESVSYNLGTDATKGLGFLARNTQRLTAENVDVKKLDFTLLNTPPYPPRITISLQVGAVNAPASEPVISLQTTISARTF